jgi:membrane associated rhomboid family serine protease
MPESDDIYPEPHDPFRPYNQPVETPRDDRAMNTFRLAAAMDKPNRVTYILCAFLLIYFLVMLLDRGLKGAFTLEAVLQLFGHDQLMKWGAWKKANIENGEVGRLLTSAWIFYGWLSAVLVLWCLRSIGRMVEGIFGGLVLVFLFVACSIAGGAAMYALAPGELTAHMPMAAPFAAIFGLSGAAVGFAVRYRRKIDPKVTRRIVFWSLFWLVLISVFSFTVYRAAYQKFLLPYDVLGGFTAGLVFGLVFRPVFLGRKASSWQALRWAAFLCAVVMVFFSLATLAPGSSARRRNRDTRRWRPGYMPADGEFQDMFNTRRGKQAPLPPVDAPLITYTDPANRFSIGYPGGFEVKTREHTVTFVTRRPLAVSVGCTERGPYDGRVESLEKMLVAICRAYPDNPPRLIDKQDDVKIGPYTFAKSQLLVTIGFRRMEVMRTIYITESDDYEYCINVDYLFGDERAAETADKMVESLTWFK